MTKHIALLGLTLALSGCALLQPAIPTTQISGVIAGQRFSLSNPKDTAITNLVVEVSTNGSAKLSIGSLSSVNNSNVINAGYSGQADLVNATGAQIINGINAGAALAGKAAAAAK